MSMSASDSHSSGKPDRLTVSPRPSIESGCGTNKNPSINASTSTCDHIDSGDKSWVDNFGKWPGRIMYELCHVFWYFLILCVLAVFPWPASRASSLVSNSYQLNYWDGVTIPPSPPVVSAHTKTSQPQCGLVFFFNKVISRRRHNIVNRSQDHFMFIFVCFACLRIATSITTVAVIIIAANLLSLIKGVWVLFMARDCVMAEK